MSTSRTLTAMEAVSTTAPPTARTRTSTYTTQQDLPDTMLRVVRSRPAPAEGASRGRWLWCVAAAWHGKAVWWVRRRVGGLPHPLVWRWLPTFITIALHMAGQNQSTTPAPLVALYHPSQLTPADGAAEECALEHGGEVRGELLPAPPLEAGAGYGGELRRKGYPALVGRALCWWANLRLS